MLLENDAEFRKGHPQCEVNKRKDQQLIVTNELILKIPQIAKTIFDVVVADGIYTYQLPTGYHSGKTKNNCNLDF